MMMVSIVLPVQCCMRKYGWDGDWIVRIPNRELVSIFHGGILKTILDLNDRDAKSFSEIADALEKMYLADRI